MLESGDLKQNPFPLFLTYIGESEQSVPWGYQQMLEQPEYLERLKTILEDKLQTKIDLQLRSRTFTNEELVSRANAQKTPFERDLDKDDGLKKLIDFFGGEFIYSKLLNKQIDLSSSDSGEEVNDN